MMFRSTLLILPVLGLALSGCGYQPPSSLPAGEKAYEAIPVQAQGIKEGAIQPGDRLYIRVLGEPDLTSDQYFVDGGGTVQVPLAGEIKTIGATTGELQEEITRRLAARFIRNPYVAVSIVQHAQSSVTVEGEVQKAGRFEASPGLTLIGALALAQSTTKTAKLDEVVIFRRLNGQRMAARFNLSHIRSGRAPDPQVIAGDTIVVGRSAIKGGWYDLLQAAPLFNIFYVLR